MEDITFVILEDDEVDAMLLRRAFNQLNICSDKIFAKDGAEGLEYLRGYNGRKKIQKPFVILLDLNMPRMSGLEFLDEIRMDDDLRKSIVFVLTTSNDEKDRALAYEKHVAGYIVKSDTAKGVASALSMIDSYRRVIEFP